MIGGSPESLALNRDESILYVANAHANAIAVVSLSDKARSASPTRSESEMPEKRGDEMNRSKVRGFIPTGQYPSAVAIAAGRIYVGNGKGTGFENSSVIVNNSGRAPKDRE